MDPVAQAAAASRAAPDHAPVIIVGGGPVGLATALGLAHHGVRSIVCERDLSAPRGSRAFGIWGRTLEILEDWRLDREFVDAGDPRMVVAPHDIVADRPIFSIDFSLLADESNVPGLLLLPQSHTERLLREAIAREDLADVVEGECVSVTQDDAGVTVALRAQDGERQLTGAYVVGADGSRSAVREGLGVRHAGETIPIDLVVFDIDIDIDDDTPPGLLDSSRKGLLAALRFAPGKWRVLMSTSVDAVPLSRPHEGPPPAKPDIPVENLSREVERLFGPVRRQVAWQSQTTIYQQRIPQLRYGRILFAGDSAHLISPAGGQGMNQGIQDAENLAWSLAAVIDGADADAMLDGYDAERMHAAKVIAKRALVNSYLELRTPPQLRPLGFFAMRTLLRWHLALRMVVRRLSMRDLRYHSRLAGRLLGRGRAIGRRVPDVVLPSGRRLSSVLRGKAAVITIGAPAQASVPPGVASVRLERFPRGWGLRRGHVLVVRPDRHIGAALRKPTPSEVADALSRCCGIQPAEPETPGWSTAA